MTSRWCRDELRGKGLQRSPGLGGACPRQGYKPFVITERWDDSIWPRRLVQGDDPRRASCPKPADAGCFELPSCP